MAYEKRVCVLKQIKKGFSADGGLLSGAVYAERLGDTLTVTPRIAGLAPVKEGAYALSVWVGGQAYCMEFQGREPLRVNGAPSLKDGFSALVAYVRGEAEPVAYGFCGTAPSSCRALLSAFQEEKGKAIKGEKKKGAPAPVPLPPTELPSPAPNVPLAPGVPVPNGAPDYNEGETKDSAPPFRGREGAKYDDEAIAASDYFSCAAHENEGTANFGETAEGEAAHGRAACEDDGAVRPIGYPRGTLTYYNEVRERIEKAFRKFPRDTRLLSAFPQSEWVNSSGAMLGVIYEKGTPRYLCVAVEKSGDPPENMKEHAVFVPATPFSDETGFYVVFQDADTGEYVHVSQS